MTSPHPGSRGNDDGRPNIVLILVDEWRAQAFGHAGDPNAHTPALDRLAAESIVFDQAISGHPVCCPARASFMTGQYPLRHGVFINDVPLRSEDPTLAEAFVHGGYSTAYIGKWHLYGSPEGSFERREQFVPPTARLGFQYWKAAECTHDYNRSAYFDQDDPTVRYWEGYDVFAQTDDAVRLLQGKSESPLFLMLSFGPPHFPLDSAPERYREMYAHRDIAFHENVPEALRDTAAEDLRGYYAHIAAIDECVGRTLEAVADSNTIVVFTSDHGDMLWSHGLEYKLVPWEESVRVPLFVRIPGRGPEHRQALFNSPDLMPTLLGLAGLEVPGSVQGKDLLAAEGPDSAFLNAPVAFSSLRRCGFDEYRGVRTSRYTYARTVRGPWLLYDNHEDPFQLINLVNDPEYAPIRAQLEQELQHWLQQLGDGFLQGSEYLRENHLEHYFEVNEPLGFCQSADGSWRSTNPRGRIWTIDTPLRAILEEPRALGILHRYAPRLAETSRAWGPEHSPRLAAMADPAALGQDELCALEAAFATLPPRDTRLICGVAEAGLPPRNRLVPTLD